VKCDVSRVGVGVVLSQEGHPITFSSRKLLPHDLSYSIYDKEMLAIMHALAKFRNYLVGNQLRVKTHHNSLRHFMGQQGLNDRQQIWVSKVQSYDFEIVYVRSKHNVLVDDLSRRPAGLSLLSIYQDWKAQLLVEYSKVRKACEVLEGTHADERYRVMDEVIYYKGHIYLVLNSQLRERVLQASHDSSLSRNQGFRKTYIVVRESFTWKGLKEDVLQHVRECEVCQRNKGELTHPTRLLQPLPIPEGKWESISMDFITGLPMV